MTNQVLPTDPRLIQELFDEDPLKLREQDLDLIIQYYRQERADFLAAEPVAKAKKISATKQAVLPLDDTISLSDLGLD